MDLQQWFPGRYSNNIAEQKNNQVAREMTEWWFDGELLGFGVYFQQVFPEYLIITSLGNVDSSSNPLSDCSNWRWAG